jgi:hypothetical protein
MDTLKRNELLNRMKYGVVYRRARLLPYSNNLDRDLNTLLKQNKLKKAGNSPRHPERSEGSPLCGTY